MRIPYGRSNFAAIRAHRFFYADKTTFLPQLESFEAGYGYLLFLRPRRIGKSLLVSMMEHYYDLARKEQFDDLFGGLWIHEHPTPERNLHLALTLDFSPVTTDAGPEVMRRSFTNAVKNGLRPFFMRYRARFPDLARLDARLDTYDDAADLIGTLLSIAAGLDHKLYLFIDEYDNFANRLLADGEQALHESIVRGTGFVRSFYAALKAGTGAGGLARMFITGVSPILLDDLSSGFNIIKPVSLQARFNTMAGFTRADVERATGELLADMPALRADPRIGDQAQLLSMLERYYNGYRFSKDAAERVFNSDLVLYFLAEIENHGRYPEQMLDLNVRTDYGRLQRIATLSGAAGAELRDLLSAILTEERVSSPIVEQFGVRNMHGREQLVSLFYYMGMLTFAPPSPGQAVPDLVVPNRVMRELQWEFLALSVKDQERVWIDTLDLEKALTAMASAGDIAPLLALFREQVVGRLGNKDLRQFNEKVLKLMLLAYISQSRTFRILSEKEFSRGYCDLFLGLSPDVPSGRYAWMLEVKYLKTEATAAEIKRAIAQAHEQLDRYLSDKDLVPLLTLGNVGSASPSGALGNVGSASPSGALGNVGSASPSGALGNVGSASSGDAPGKEIKAGALVFVGAKEVLFRAWPPDSEKALDRAAKKPRSAAKKTGSVPRSAAKKTGSISKKPRSAAKKPRSAAKER